MGEQRSEEQGYRLIHYKTLAPCRTLRYAAHSSATLSLASSQEKARNNSGMTSYPYEEKLRTYGR